MKLDFSWELREGLIMVLADLWKQNWRHVHTFPLSFSHFLIYAKDEPENAANEW